MATWDKWDKSFILLKVQWFPLSLVKAISPFLTTPQKTYRFLNYLNWFVKQCTHFSSCWQDHCWQVYHEHPSNTEDVIFFLQSDTNKDWFYDLTGKGGSELHSWGRAVPKPWGNHIPIQWTLLLYSLSCILHECYTILSKRHFHAWLKIPTNGKPNTF